MKFIALAALFTVASAHDLHARHGHGSAARLVRRQDPLASTIPLASITSGMPVQPTQSAATTYPAGAQPPIPGAPPLPAPFVFTDGQWPTPDQLPDTTSPEVQEWMQELNGFDIPDLDPTVDGTCATDPTAAADAANRGWWTCGGYTRSTDIIACPDKFTWGTSYDDGPSDYTQTLLDFLGSKNLTATFFTVGSRTIERPQILVEEYMSGHEISVHTWSHPALTKLTNIQIVAELGWTRKAIQTILGVTPTTMRPPYGDIDDRVRAISLAMGLIPIIWTRGPEGNQFDTDDWEVPGGIVTGVESFQNFQYILSNASAIDTGFIVLEHDLFQETVDLAVDYFLPAALGNNPPLTLMSIGRCQGWPLGDMYLETTTNTTFPYSNSSSTEDVSTTASARAAAQSSLPAAANGKQGSATGSGSGVAPTGKASTTSGAPANTPTFNILFAGALALAGWLFAA